MNSPEPMVSLASLDKLISKYLNQPFRKIDFYSPQKRIQEITSDLFILLEIHHYKKSNSKALPIIYILTEFLEELRDSMGNNYCFFSGKLRVYYVLQKLYLKINDPHLIPIPKSFIDNGIVQYLFSQYHGNGLLNGKVGFILGTSLVTDVTDQNLKKLRDI